MRLMAIRNGPKQIIFANGGFKLLHKHIYIYIYPLIRKYNTKKKIIIIEDTQNPKF